MASLLVLFLLHAVLCFADAAQNFQEVSVCPRNADTWKIESDKKNCKGDTPDYLCAAIENNVNRYGEICTKYGLSPANKCAVLNNQTHNLDSVDCKAASGCPAVPYNPSELWKYPICYGDFYGTTRAPSTTTTVQTTAPPVSGPQESGGSGAAIGVVVALLILVAVGVVVLMVLYRKDKFGVRQKMEPLFDNIRKHLPGNREGQTKPADRTDVEIGEEDDTEDPLLHDLTSDEAPVNDSEKRKQETEKDKKGLTAGDSNEQNQRNNEEMKIRKLYILQKYLVHILKREIDVKDLKEKSIIHSKSLKEHFTQPLLQDLYSVEKADDYNKLDMSLVLTLLRNFCVNIKAPKRGWDYEPPDDERTVGADIERIRSMWNKYCDNNYEFKNLDDVFNKMKQTYGTVAVQDEQNNTTDESERFSEIKEKIQSVILNPDCLVEEGIVMTESIRSALQSLEMGNVVICKGTIGCGKTHALKAIQNRYEEKGWKVKWIEERLFIQEESLEDETLVICDNLLGSYGCNTFSSKELFDIESLFEKMLEKSGKLKVAVGIHQHVFDEVKKLISGHLKLLQNKNITVDFDNLTQSELLLILKGQQKEGHCKTNPNCWFKGVDLTLVIDKLRENQGHIGSPFLSLMYCHWHDLFSDEAFTKVPIQSLTQRFQKVRSASIDYYSLVYLMCVRKHKYEDDLKSWAGLLEANLTKESIQSIAKKMPGFIRVENGVAAICHEVLAIALFKATSNVDEVFLPVVQNCEVEILLQLVRAADSCNAEFSYGFANPEKSTQARYNVCKFLVKRFADEFKSDWYSIDHPLKVNEFFRSKFEHYITKSPKVK